ncbi:MAG TPA: hypothetical protein VIA81_07165 [Acidimicrobiia bacterium]
MTGLLAHHFGSIPEIAVFVVPAVLAIFALRWAERRARDKAADRDEATGSLSSAPDE